MRVLTVYSHLVKLFKEVKFNSSAYEDDIHPEDSVSVFSAFSSKDSDGLNFENIDSFQVRTN